MSSYEKHLISDPRLPFIFHHYIYPKNWCPSALGTSGGGNWHENIEILHFVSGSATVICNENRFEVRKGDTVVVNTNFLHDILTSQPIEFYCIIIDRSFCLANHFDTNDIFFEPLIQDPALTELIISFAQEFKSSEAPYRIQALRATALSIMALLCKNHIRPSNSDHTEEHLLSSIKLALGYIYTEIEKPLTLDRIATEAKLSKYYLAREFHRITGYTVVSYINRVRCDNAAKLLTQSNQTIESIARSCGFSNISYFTRTFKKTIGMLPREYRRKYAKRG